MNQDSFVHRGKVCNLEMNQDMAVVDANGAREDSWYGTS